VSRWFGLIPEAAENYSKGATAAKGDLRPLWVGPHPGTTCSDSPPELLGVPYYKLPFNEQRTCYYFEKRLEAAEQYTKGLQAQAVAASIPKKYRDALKTIGIHLPLPDDVEDDEYDDEDDEDYDY